MQRTVVDQSTGSFPVNLTIFSLELSFGVGWRHVLQSLSVWDGAFGNAYTEGSFFPLLLWAAR